MNEWGANELDGTLSKKCTEAEIGGIVGKSAGIRKA
jgi:hypothetical protein